MRKILVWILTAAMILTLAGCGSSKTDYSGQTIYGKITAINGDTYTLALGSVSEKEMTQGSFDMQKPDGDAGDGSENSASPEMPEGDDTNAPSDMPSGGSGNADGANGDSTDGIPEKPEGDDANASSDMPSGGPGNADGANGDSTEGIPEKPEGDDANASSDMPSGGPGNADGANGNGTDDIPEKPDDDDANAPSDMSSGDSGNGNNAEGEMPEGEAPQGMGNMSIYEFTASEDGTTADFEIASTTEVTSGNEQITASELEVDMCLEIVFDDNGDISSITVLNTGSGAIGSPSDNDANLGMSGTVNQGSAAYTISEDSSVTGESYSSTEDDENALRISGATVTLDGITVDKSSGDSSDSDSGNFYGLNAACLATDEADVTISNSKISSSVSNGNGIFAYGSGTTVNVSDTEIYTTGDNSGGIMTTGGAITNASNLTVETNGSSSAAIRTDRGGGTVTVNGGTYTTNGYDSPAVYSTADITVSDASLVANSSESLVIEGDNSISLNNCFVSGNMSDDKGTSSSENVHSILIYQSTSGDAEEGTSELTVSGGSLICNNGDLIHVTNTDCIISLTNVEIQNLDEEGYLLNISGNNSDHGWGTAGANGGNVVFTAADQTLTGNIIVDSISTLSMTLGDNSSFTGTINIVDNTENGTSVSDNAVITIEQGSTWTLTGNCTITSLTNLGTINYNGYTITLADGTVLK